jgi:hypothetical protein
MSLDADLNAVCDYLRSRLDLNVAVGRPNEAVPGLYVWPWQIVPKTEARNLPPRQGSGRSLLSFRIHCLVLITPADTLETVSKLDLAGKVLQENPIVEGPASLVRVTLDTIAPGDLAALFSAARLQLTLCHAFVLEGSPPSNPHRTLRPDNRNE